MTAAPISSAVAKRFIRRRSSRRWGSSVTGGSRSCTAGAGEAVRTASTVDKAPCEPTPSVTVTSAHPPGVARAVLPPGAPLRATYRVQLHAGFGFDDAAPSPPTSPTSASATSTPRPILQAAPGSTHGYDVVDHAPRQRRARRRGRLRAPGGGAAASTGWASVLDIVPNHMSIAGRDNAWWWDVLENGPSSRYAAYFDVDWDPPEDASSATRVLMPILGDHYGRVLEAGELQLGRDGGSFTDPLPRARDARSPPRSLDDLLAAAAAAAASDELAFLADSLGHAPARRPTPTRASVIGAPPRQGGPPPGAGAPLLGAPEIGRRHRRGDRARSTPTPTELDALLERQNYRLAYWRTAGEELDYRRFFDINTLVGLRIEDERVFEDTHALVLGLGARGRRSTACASTIPTACAIPAEYLERLREHAPGRAGSSSRRSSSRGEALPDDWPVAGTTGYDFLNRVGGLFVDPDGEQALTDCFTPTSPATTADYRRDGPRARSTCVLQGALRQRRRTA